MDLTFRNVHNFCARIDLSEDRPTVDLSAVTWLEPYAIIYLGMLLRHHNRLGRFFKLIYPSKPGTKDYLTRQNFWERFQFTPDPKNDRRLLHSMPNTSFKDIIDLEDKPDQAEEVSFRLWEIMQNSAVAIDPRDVTEAAAELVDNFVQHAEQGLAAMMVQYYPNYHCLRLAVGDCGIGIRQSLTNSGRYPEIAAMSHQEAIAEAFKDEVTRKEVGGMGFGSVQNIVCKQSAELFISSFDGCVYIDNRGKMYYRDTPHELPGVQVEICFPER